MTYQDIWRAGTLLTRGKRDCAERYDIIRPALEKRLGKGFTVADVGGWDGYFGIRLTEDCNATALNIDQRNRDLPIEHRQLKVTADTVSQVGFHDVILVLSVLHHMDDWRDVYQALRDQSRLLVVELAHPDEATTAKVDGAARNTAPSYEQVMADGQVLGSTKGPNGVDRPIVLVRNAAWGTVEDGTGQATPLITEGDFTALGYEPYPGTLNVRVGIEAVRWFASKPHVEIPSGRSNDWYIGATVEGVPCHASFQRSRHILELLAPVNLRETLGAINGDELEIR